jgi:hypothetical protein
MRNMDVLGPAYTQISKGECTEWGFDKTTGICWSNRSALKDLLGLRTTDDGVVYCVSDRTSSCGIEGGTLEDVGYVVLRVMLSGIPYGYAYVTPETLRAVMEEAECPRSGASGEFSAVPSDVRPTDWHASDTALPEFVTPGNASWAFVECLILVVSAESDSRFRVATFRNGGGAWVTPGLRTRYCPDDVAAYALWQGSCNNYESY